MFACVKVNAALVALMVPMRFNVQMTVAGLWAVSMTLRAQVNETFPPGETVASQALEIANTQATSAANTDLSPRTMNCSFFDSASPASGIIGTRKFVSQCESYYSRAQCSDSASWIG